MKLWYCGLVVLPRVLGVGVSWSQARYVFAPCHLVNPEENDSVNGKDCVLVSAYAYPENHETVTRIMLLISARYSLHANKLVPVAEAIQNYTHSIYCELNNETRQEARSVEFPPNSLGRSDTRGVLIECRSSLRSVNSLEVKGAIKTFAPVRLERMHFAKAPKIVFLLAQIFGDPAHLNPRLAFEYIQHHTALGADLFIGTLRMCSRNFIICPRGGVTAQLQTTPWLMRWAFNQSNMYFIDIQDKIETALPSLAPNGVYRSIRNNGAGVYITLYEGVLLCKALKAEWVVRIDLDEWLVSQASPGTARFLPFFLDTVKNNFPTLNWLATFSRLVAAIPTHPERPRLATRFTKCFQGPNTPALPRNQCEQHAPLFSPDVHGSPLSYLLLNSSSQPPLSYSTNPSPLRKHENVFSGHSGSRGKWIARVDRITYGNIHHAGPGHGFAIPSNLLALMHFRSIGVGNISETKTAADIDTICQEFKREPDCHIRFPKYCGVGFCCLRHCDWLEPYAWNSSSRITPKYF